MSSGQVGGMATVVSRIKDVEIVEVDLANVRPTRRYAKRRRGINTIPTTPNPGNTDKKGAQQ